MDSLSPILMLIQAMIRIETAKRAVRNSDIGIPIPLAAFVLLFPIFGVSMRKMSKTQSTANFTSRPATITASGPIR